MLTQASTSGVSTRCSVTNHDCSSFGAQHLGHQEVVGTVVADSVGAVRGIAMGAAMLPAMAAAFAVLNSAQVPHATSPQRVLAIIPAATLANIQRHKRDRAPASPVGVTG